MDLHQHIRTVPDFPKPGIQFKDITTLLKNPEAFDYVIELMIKRYDDAGLTKIIGVESRGFIFGSALAHRMKIGFIPVRKAGKLPADVYKKSYALEYGEATIELHKDSIDKNDHVLVVDDLLATGGTLVATSDLIAQTGANIHAFWLLIELGFLGGREKLEKIAPIHTELIVD